MRKMTGPNIGVLGSVLCLSHPQREQPRGSPLRDAERLHRFVAEYSGEPTLISFRPTPKKRHKNYIRVVAILLLE